MFSTVSVFLTKGLYLMFSLNLVSRHILTFQRLCVLLWRAINEDLSSKERSLLSKFHGKSKEQVLSMAIFVSTHQLTHSVAFSRLDWCDSVLLRCQLKTCWGCYYRWCWCWETWFWGWGSGEVLKLKFGQYFAAEVWLRLRSWILVNIL